MCVSFAFNVTFNMGIEFYIYYILFYIEYRQINIIYIEYRQINIIES